MYKRDPVNGVSVARWQLWGKDSKRGYQGQPRDHPEHHGSENEASLMAVGLEACLEKPQEVWWICVYSEGSALLGFTGWEAIREERMGANDSL